MKTSFLLTLFFICITSVSAEIELDGKKFVCNDQNIKPFFIAYDKGKIDCEATLEQTSGNEYQIWTLISYKKMKDQQYPVECRYRNLSTEKRATCTAHSI